MKETIVVVVDAGGRGSALVDKYLQSPHVDKVFAIPGNDLMKVDQPHRVATFSGLSTTSVADILTICQTSRVALADVAQDNAVQVGLVDQLRKLGIKAVGPTKRAGRIEWDKVWAREFGTRWGLPQPSFWVCNDEQEALKLLSTLQEQPLFIKAAFLAEGKGAKGARTLVEAAQKIRQLRQEFLQAARRFLLEQWLLNNDGTLGEEFSTYLFSDGESYQIVGSAQDHKRALDNDQGENTGGMGCSSPPLVLTPELLRRVDQEILVETIRGLMEEGRPYTGVLYLGGILLDTFNLSVVEFNARWGDPEAQAVVPSIKNDLFEVSMAIAEGKLNQILVKADKKARVVVAGVSRGYPGDYSQIKGKEIFGLDKISEVEGVKLFGAGVKISEGRYFANGGRLFYLMAEGVDVIEARKKVYQAMEKISIGTEGDNLHFRTDIGLRDVKRLTARY